MNENALTLTARIAAASIDVGGRLKADKRNTEQNYNYISADKILAECGQALASQGVVLFPAIVQTTCEPVQYKEGKIRYDARVDFVMRLAADAESLEFVWLGLGSDYSVPDKAVYKAITSGHRYFLAKLLNVGEGNEDGEHETGDLPTTTAASAATRPAVTTGPVPTCPKCGGPMWDNRTTKTNPKQPDYKCKDKANCDGALWPPKDTPAERQQAAGRPLPQDEPPPPDDEFDNLPSALDAPITDAVRKAMFAQAKKVYGDNLDEFRTWIHAQYHVESTNNLTLRQATEIIELLRKQAEPA